jgi:hypothetical protein
VSSTSRSLCCSAVVSVNYLTRLICTFSVAFDDLCKVIICLELMQCEFLLDLLLRDKFPYSSPVRRAPNPLLRLSWRILNYPDNKFVAVREVSLVDLKKIVK